MCFSGEVGLYNTAVFCVYTNRLYSCIVGRACRVIFYNDVDISCKGTQVAAALNAVQLLGPVCCLVLLVAVLVEQARLNGSS